MSTPSDASSIDKLLSLSFFGGLFFYAVNVVLFAKALDSLPVSVAYPILAAIGFGLLVLASAVLFGETMRLPQMIGLGLVVAGIALLARGTA